MRLKLSQPSLAGVGAGAELGKIGQLELKLLVRQDLTNFGWVGVLDEIKAISTQLS